MSRTYKPLSGACLAAFVVCAIPSGGVAVAADNCGAKPDEHQKWEVVFRTEPTHKKAEASQARIKAAGFKFKTFIEVESCHAFEVATNQFPTKAAAQKHLDEAKALGFREATIEKS
jgi:hypothetical protein